MNKQLHKNRCRNILKQVQDGMTTTRHRNTVILNSFQNLIIVSFLFIFTNSFSQTITHGPIVGAVTSTSVKILLITDTVNRSEILKFDKRLLEQDPIGHICIFIKGSGIESLLYDIVGSKIYDSLDWSFMLKNRVIDPVKNNVHIFKFDSLLPNTTYEYTVNLPFFEGSYSTGSFKTFPTNYQPTNFSFTLGSCTEQHHNDSIFVEMQKHKPTFFLHLGDWLYPDNFKEDKFYYDENLEHQKELYQKRYEMPNLKTFLQTTPMDFVFDDEDGVYDDFSKNSYTEIKMNGNATEIKEVPYPDSLRKMAIKGLHTFFPSYKEIEDQAYHSFVYGNAEVFFLDTRSTRSPNSEVFTKTKSGKYKYKVPKGHTILDTAQMNWLLTKLKNSKADWKFIVSGVTFNKSYKQVLDMCMRVQNRKLPNGLTGAYVATSLASMWFAFPETQQKLIEYCNDNQIKNVIVLSGDAHTAGIDDGTNAGFPELMAGGLAQTNSKLVSIIKNTMRLNLWNQGGQGINNSNFNDAFGKVEVFGKDSVRLSAIDKYGTEICHYEVKNGFLPEKYNIKPYNKIFPRHKIRSTIRLLKIALHH